MTSCTQGSIELYGDKKISKIQSFSSTASLLNSARHFSLPFYFPFDFRCFHVILGRQLRDYKSIQARLLKSFTQYGTNFVNKFGTQGHRPGMLFKISLWHFHYSSYNTNRVTPHTQKEKKKCPRVLEDLQTKENNVLKLQFAYLPIIAIPKKVLFRQVNWQKQC